MTDIEAKALALVNEIECERCEKELTRRIMRGRIMDEVLCRAIERHEAYEQKVSDAVERAVEIMDIWCDDVDFLRCFIIPKPDPLADALADTFGASLIDADELRAALEARGLEIREKGQ